MFYFALNKNNYDPYGHIIYDTQTNLKDYHIAYEYNEASEKTTMSLKQMVDGTSEENIRIEYGYDKRGALNYIFAKIFENEIEWRSLYRKEST